MNENHIPPKPSTSWSGIPLQITRAAIAEIVVLLSQQLEYAEATEVRRES